MRLHDQIWLSRWRASASDGRSIASGAQSAATSSSRPSIRRSIGHRVIAVGRADRRGAVTRAGSVPLRSRASSPTSKEILS